MKKIDMLKNDFLTKIDFYTLKDINIDKTYVSHKKSKNLSNDVVRKSEFDGGEVTFTLRDEFDTATVKVIFTINEKSIYDIVTIEFNLDVDTSREVKKKKKKKNNIDYTMSLTDRIVIEEFGAIELYKRLCYTQISDAKLSELLLTYI